MFAENNTVIWTLLGTLFGVAITGTINYLSNRSVKNMEWRLSLAKDQATSRQKLYAEFLVESQRLILQSIEEKISSVKDLNTLSCKFTEIQLVASIDIVKVAEKIMNVVLSSQTIASKKEDDLGFVNLKKLFVEAVRQDMVKAFNKS